MYSSGNFYGFIQLWNHHHGQDTEYFHHLQKIPVTLCRAPPLIPGLR